MVLVMVIKPLVQNKKSQKKKQIQDPLRMKFTKVDAMERFKRKFQGDTTTKTPKTNSDFRGVKSLPFFVFQALGPSCSLGFLVEWIFWKISRTFWLSQSLPAKRSSTHLAKRGQQLPGVTCQATKTLKVSLSDQRCTVNLHPGKLTWQWINNHLKMYILLKNVDFLASHDSFNGATHPKLNPKLDWFPKFEISICWRFHKLARKKKNYTSHSKMGIKENHFPTESMFSGASLLLVCSRGECIVPQFS